MPAIIRIPHYKAEIFSKDLSEILQSKFTFDEALKNGSLPVLVRRRLTIIKRQLFTNLENVAAVLMMHTPNEVLLEQNDIAHAELLNKYETILQESFNQWHSYASKKTNALINAQQNTFSKNNHQLINQSMQSTSENISIAINHEIHELTRISRQAAIMNLLTAILVLISAVLVLVILS